VTATFPGTIRASLSSRLQGAEANGVWNIATGNCYRLDLLGGFRWLQLAEDLDTDQSDAVSITASGLSEQANGVTAVALALDLTRQEQFSARNNFYGGQAGARLELNRQRVFVDLAGRLGLGDMHENVTVSGTATAAGTLALTNAAGVTRTTSLAGPAPGWLAQPTNIGSYSRDRFAVVPEATVRLGYALTDNLHASVGYTFLYCSNVVRPGDQIDTAQGPGHPAFSFHETDFWAQGIDLQVEVRY
jgi:hypothetical protein